VTPLFNAKVTAMYSDSFASGAEIKVIRVKVMKEMRRKF
jgi:hypothetical protein